MKEWLKIISTQFLIYRYLRVSNKFLALNNKVIKRMDEVYKDLPEQFRPKPIVMSNQN